MERNRKYLAWACTFMIWLAFLPALSQTRTYEFNSTQLDSLLHLSRKKGDVSGQIKTLNDLGAYYESVSNYHEARKFLHASIVLAKKHLIVEEEIRACNFLGYVEWHESNYERALYYHNHALDLANRNNISGSNKAFTFLMLGNDYYDKGDYTKTSEYYYNALKMFEELKDVVGQIQTHNRLGKLYFKLKDLKDSKQQATTAQALNKNIGFKREEAVSNNNLGNIAIEQGDLDSALYFFNVTYSKFTACGDVIGRSVAAINLGDTYLSMHEKSNTSSVLDSALYYYKHSFILNKQVNNSFGVIYGLWGMGDVSMKKNETDLGRLYYRQALQTSILISAKNEESQLYWKIYKTFSNNKDSAFVYLQKYVETKKEADQEVQTKALLRQESKYEIEKKLAEKNAEIERDQLVTAEKNKWKNLLIIGVIVIALVLIYAVFISIKRIRVIASTNKTINTINNELTSQRKEITDSITYARRIQEAILPSKNSIQKYLPQSFILYKPKDIVAGDFYWMERVEKEDLILIAAADCTGHGVPGALVSVVCCNALNRAVNEFKLYDPGAILTKTRELVIDTLSKSDTEVKDGMDISLLRIDAKTKTISWSGANNPLWFISSPDPSTSSGAGAQLKEIKANKQPIGTTDQPKPFTTHTIEFVTGTNFYLFTDGYADQFGGPKGKKFKYKQLEEIIVASHQLPLDEQLIILNREFEQWKGSLEQVDDVCVIGFRL